MTLVGGLLAVAIVCVAAFFAMRTPAPVLRAKAKTATPPIRSTTRKDGSRTLNGIAVYRTRRVSDDLLRIWWSYTVPIPTSVLQFARPRRRGDAEPAEAVLRTGDAGFDAAWFIGGDSTTGTAALDADTRRALTTLFMAYDASLVTGRLVANAQGDPDTDPGHDRCEELVATVGRAALEAERDPWGRARALLNDPEPGVRAAAAQRLAARPPDAADHGALMRAQQDPDAAVRFHVARALGDGGAATLRAVLNDPAVDGPRRAQWLDRLVTEGRLPIVQEALGALREATDLELRCAAVRASGRSSEPDATTQVQRAARSPQPAVRLAAADALGQRLVRGEDTAEPALLDLLNDADPQVAIGAAEALGAAAAPNGTPRGETRVTRAALEPLRHAARHGAPGLRTAADLALARVQAALGG